MTAHSKYLEDSINDLYATLTNLGCNRPDMRQLSLDQLVFEEIYRHKKLGFDEGVKFAMDQVLQITKQQTEHLNNFKSNEEIEYCNRYWIKE